MEYFFIKHTRHSDIFVLVRMGDVTIFYTKM